MTSPELETILASAESAELNGHFRLAYSTLAKAVMPAWNADDPILPTILNRMGLAARMIGKVEAQDRYFSKALLAYQAALGASHLPEDNVESYANLADLSRVTGNLDNAFAYMQQAEDILHDMPDCDERDLFELRLDRQYGLIHDAKGELVTAEELYRGIIPKGEALMSRRPMDRQLRRSLAQIYQQFGDLLTRKWAKSSGQGVSSRSYDEAYGYQDRSIDLFFEVGDPQGILNVVRTIGGIMDSEGDYRKAISHLLPPYQRIEGKKKTRPVGHLALMLGEAYLRIGDAASASAPLNVFWHEVSDGNLMPNDIAYLRDRYIRTKSLTDPAPNIDFHMIDRAFGAPGQI